MATRGNLANRTVVGWSQYEGRQQQNPKLLKREAVWESQEQEGVACITRSKQGNSPVSTARRSLFFYFITSIHLCLFQLVLFLSFILPLPSLCLFFTLPTLLLLDSQRHCPQNYPDSSLKSSSWNHQITTEKERIQRVRRALEGKNLFFTVSLLSLSPLRKFTQILTEVPSHTLKVKRHSFQSSPTLLLSRSLQAPFPPSFSAYTPPSLSQVKC